MTLDEARESLAILKETERFLLQDIGAGGKLTLSNTGEWAEELVRCRRFIKGMEDEVARLEVGGGEGVQDTAEATQQAEA
jgi:hypothetical protein